MDSRETGRFEAGDGPHIASSFGGEAFGIHADTFAVVNLGCKVNRVETDSIAAAFLAAGIASAPETDADIIVVNTCTVTGEADKKARKTVHHALSVNDHAQIVVTGCAAALEADLFEALDERVRVVQRGKLESWAQSCIGARPLRWGDGFHTRVNVKIQDGCDHACTYCIVHIARGHARSRDASSVLEEIDGYLRAGVREVVLTGINLGSYRSDGVDLAGIVRRAVERCRLERTAQSGGVTARVRIGSVEPQDIGCDLVELLAASNGTLCRHLHLPLQSGSTRVLSQMDRPYTAEEYERLVESLYASVPRMSLSTDVIVGFPGETESDFQKTLALCRRCRFSKIHVFPYSKRAGTPAALREDQIPAEVKRDRARRLRRLSEELAQQDYNRRCGTVEYVLVEPDRAVTESYHELARPHGVQTGELEPIRLSASDAR